MERQSVQTVLNTLGFRSPPNMAMYGYIEQWRKWYNGLTGFHSYRIYNGINTHNCVRKSLRMGKKTAEDRADLLLNEHVLIQSSKEENNQFIQEVLRETNFLVESNRTIEKGSALGTAAFVLFKQDDPRKESKVGIDYIKDAAQIYPLSFIGEQITECAFVSEIFVDGEECYNISIHQRNKTTKNYEVHNFLYTVTGIPRVLPDKILSVWETGSSRPTFQIYKPNIENNLVENSPMGISIYANALDVFQVLDGVYDSYFNEFILGKKRIFADATVLNMDMDPNSPTKGKVRPVFDPNDTVFYNYPGWKDSGALGNSPIVESNMSLRVTEHNKALQDNLDLVSELVGFGKGYYKFEADQVQTATEVISQNSKLYRKMQKENLLLGRLITELFEAILELNNKDTDRDVNVSFDDSIIEDTNAIINRSLLEYQAGVIDDVMYFMITRKVTEKVAMKLVKDRNKREEQLKPKEEGVAGDAVQSDPSGAMGNVPQDTNRGNNSTGTNQNDGANQNGRNMQSGQ